MGEAVLTMRASRQLLRMLVGRRYVICAITDPIQTALDGISDNKAIRPYTIKGAAGTYTEQMTFKSYVSFDGEGPGVTILTHEGTAGNNRATIFPGHMTKISNCTVQATGAEGASVCDKGHAVNPILHVEIINCILDATYDCTHFTASLHVELYISHCVLTATYDGIAYNAGTLGATASYYCEVRESTVHRTESANVLGGLFYILGKAAAQSCALMEDCTLLADSIVQAGSGNYLINISKGTFTCRRSSIHGTATNDTPNGLYGLRTGTTAHVELYECDIGVTNAGSGFGLDLYNNTGSFLGVDATTIYATSSGVITNI